LLAILVTFAAPGCVSAGETLIDNFNRTASAPWGFWGGLEFPPGGDRWRHDKR
jgi:hypothetical protein